jgi:hypothetical protein
MFSRSFACRLLLHIMTKMAMQSSSTEPMTATTTAMKASCV